MDWISVCGKTVGRVPRAVLLALSALIFLPDNLSAQGLPVETGSPVPIAIWAIGTVVLGLALAYGIMRNRSRTRAEKQITDQATKNVYAEEERDRLRTHGS
jgi:hypothetical protein